MQMSVVRLRSVRCQLIVQLNVEQFASLDWARLTKYGVEIGGICAYIEGQVRLVTAPLLR
jgi:hypothetical protein